MILSLGTEELLLFIIGTLGLTLILTIPGLIQLHHYKHPKRRYRVEARLDMTYVKTGPDIWDFEYHYKPYVLVCDAVNKKRARRQAIDSLTKDKELGRVKDLERHIIVERLY